LGAGEEEVAQDRKVRPDRAKDDQAVLADNDEMVEIGLAIGTGPEIEV
jgi:hypothetical protein